MSFYFASGAGHIHFVEIVETLMNGSEERMIIVCSMNASVLFRHELAYLDK
jgi:hypothetical protein